MVDYKTFNFESFDFSEELEESWKSRFAEILLELFLPRLLFPRLPVRPKTQRPLGRKTFLEDFAKSIGLFTPHLQPVLALHTKRLDSRHTIWRFANLVSLLTVVIILIFGLPALMRIVKPIFEANLGSPFFTTVVEVATVTTVQLLFMFVIAGMFFRLASALTYKYFAESLCVLEAVYVVVALNREDVLNDPRKRAYLVTRLEDLARVTRLLSFRYRSKNETNQQWINNHFRQLQQYILERARWAVAPTASTLDALRQDFYKIAGIYAEGSYGSFSWQSQYDLPDRSLTWTTRLYRTTPAFVAIVAPAILLVLLPRQREYLQDIGITPQIIALILIAWLLLAIDGALKLGVVAGLANLAKEIKSLK